MTYSNTKKCFPTYFLWHYLTLKNNLLFKNPLFKKKNKFSANKRGINCSLMEPNY